MELYADAYSKPELRGPFTGRDAMAILRRRWKLVLSFFFICVLIASIKCILGTRRYEAVAAIQVQKDESDALGIESTLGSSAEGASDALDYNITLQTQARVLGSDTLALAVIQGLDLEHNDDFTGVHAWFRIPAWVTPWNKVVYESAVVPIENAPERRRGALKTFEKRLKVQIEPGTRIINVSYLSTEPATASAVVNRLISEFKEYNFKTRFEATAQVSDWLGGQLAGIDSKAQDANRKVAQLQREIGLFGDDAQHNVILARLDALNEGLVTAEENRILAEALDKVMASGNPETIGAINAGGNAAFSSNTAAALALIQQLRSRQSELNAALQLNLTKFGPNYPLVLEEQAQLQSVEHSLHDEAGRMAKRVHSEYQISAIAENASRLSLERQKAVVEKLNSRAMDYVVAKQDADSTRDLLEDLKKKLNDAKLLSGLRSSNITVVDRARTPSHHHPKEPNIPLTLAIGGVLGMFIGGLIAGAADAWDTRIHTASQLETLLGTTPLAILPRFEPSQGWPSTPQLSAKPSVSFESLDPDSGYAEALRSLRTSLLLSRSQCHPKVILITSAQAGEGKSTTALHLASILSQLGGKVLVVDADLRRPTLHQKLRISNERGLTTLLSEEEASSPLHSLGGRDDRWVLTAGPRPPYPAELLSSERMATLLGEWRSSFDFILIDSPPVLPVTDAVVLSSKADIVLLVARHRISTTHAVSTAYHRLAKHGESNRVATIFNCVGRRSADLASYYGYGYPYGREPETRGIHVS